jgi:hypothetical protein
MLKHYIVYRTTCEITGQYYIGVHGQLEDDVYLGSGLHLKRLIKKYGQENFSRQTLFIFETEKEAFNKEVELLKSHLDNPLNVNISSGGDGGANFKGKTHSKETRALIGELSRGRKHSLETREKLSEGNRRRSANGFVAKGNLGRKLSDEHRSKISESVKTQAAQNPRTHSDKTREKLSKAAKGRTLSSETKAKLSEKWSSQDRKDWGEIQRSKWTPEMRKKQGERSKGTIPWNKKLDCGHIGRDKCSCMPDESLLKVS